jgi:tryptophan synthase beta subunit
MHRGLRHEQILDKLDKGKSPSQEDLQLIREAKGDEDEPAGRTIDKPIEMLEAQRQRLEFFKRSDLVNMGRHWLNRDLKQCLVDEWKVVVIDYSPVSRCVLRVHQHDR